MPQLSIVLLGRLQITLDGEPVTDFIKARALLAYLSVESDRVHCRDTLAGLLWPDQPQRKARHNLRQALSHLRQSIRDRDAAFLYVDRETIQFNRNSDHRLDVSAFTDLILACRTHSHRQLGTCLACVQRMAAAIQLYQGDFLAQFFISDSDLFEEWALLKREWLQRQAIDALGQLAYHHEWRGDYDQARQFVWRQVEMEPWREESHRQLVRLLAFDGQRSAALAQYKTCRQTLAQELGVKPTQETVKLVQQIQAGELDAPPRPANNLPLSPTAFVGRKAELFDLAERLADPNCRLLTLLGPGGIGKTRLALQAAADQIGAFMHGVYFVPLAPVDSARLIASPVAAALGFTFYGNQAPNEQLVSYLGKKKLLLVLDSLEHLLPANEFLSDLLYRAPGVVLLVTSRERLNLQEEWIYEIQGLGYPQDQMEQATAGYSAVELFLQRARRLYRRFAPTTQQMPHVIRICQLVQGMPLGIELAAAWVLSRSCDQIATELEHNLDILTSSLRNAPPRHRSMHAAFDHSWDLISKEEQDTLGKLSVFRGSFQEQAAQQIAAAEQRTLAALIDKSLLRQVAPGRYEMHELLRQYTSEKLQQTPHKHTETQDKHCQYYIELLQACEDWLKGAKQRKALEQISAEIENLRAAWRWATHQANAAQITKGIHSLGYFNNIRCLYQEGVEAFSSVIERLEELSTSPQQQIALGRSLAWLGNFYYQLGLYDQAQVSLEHSLAILNQPESAFPLCALALLHSEAKNYIEAEPLFQQSLDLCQASGDQYGAAQALDGCGDVAVQEGQWRQGQDYYEQALTIRRQIQDIWGISISLGRLGGVVGRLGKYEQARVYFKESLTITQELGHKRGLAACLHNLGSIAYIEQDYHQSRVLRQQALDICLDIGYQWGIASSYKSLANIASHLGEHQRAYQYLQKSLALFEEMGNPSGQAFALSSLANAAQVLGDKQQAWQYFQRALQISTEIQHLALALDVLGDVAEFLAQEGAEGLKRALELTSLILNHPASEQQTKDDIQPLHIQWLSQLPPHTASAAQARGQKQSLEDAVAQILNAATNST